MQQVQVFYLDEYKFSHRKKEEEIILDLNILLDWIIDASIILHEEADSKNIAICIKLFLNSFKENYKNVYIKF